MATGLFAVNDKGKYFSNDNHKSLLEKPRKGLSNEQYDQFILGRSFFTIPWVEAPSATTARDGLGPLFNANTCKSCHPGNGRGELYTNDNKVSRSLVVRVSIPSDGSKKHETLASKMGFVPHEVYGNQISINGVHGVPFEARVKVDFEKIKVDFPDGEKDTILKPKYELVDKNYGDLDDAILSYRMAQTMHGLGMIEKISDESILANEDINDSNGDGISGKANRVYSPLTKQEAIGRYTWKASAPSILEQVAGAANNDMSITTSLHINDNCTSSQKECNEAPKPRHKEDLPDLRLGAIDFYIRNLRAYEPIKDEEFKEGLEVFKALDCAKCHTTSFSTVDGFEVSPYSDFLLHDMGEGLADGRVEFDATASEFRTAPLWGLSLHKKINGKNPRLLHDGRARNFQEAILWHGGEAENAKQKYMNASKQTREKLIKFLERL